MHVYEEDKEMAIRLLSEGRWIFQFEYYDGEDEFIELLQPLTRAEIDLIPKGLQKVMLKVLASEEGLRLSDDSVCLVIFFPWKLSPEAH